MSELRLSSDELAFLRYTCNIFFLPESPLSVFEAEKREPKSFASTHDVLVKKGLVDPHTWMGKETALQGVQVVAECDARVLWQRYDRDGKHTRDFYVMGGLSVEFNSGDARVTRDADGNLSRDDQTYLFGEPRREQAVVDEVIKQFSPAPPGRTLVDQVFSPGEYLVFAVFARDVRAAPPDQADHMTLEEVMACFEDEPSTVPRDSDFEKHAHTLTDRGLLTKDATGNYALHNSLHGFARGLSSDKYDAFTRYDFIDDEWLIRETTVYPVPSSVFLLSSLADGAVAVQELGADELYEVLAQAIATLPDVSDDPNKPRLARDFFLRA